MKNSFPKFSGALEIFDKCISLAISLMVLEYGRRGGEIDDSKGECLRFLCCVFIVFVIERGI